MAMDREYSHITIYTDGAAAPNPGPGGYGVVLLSGQHRKELSCGYEMTTNNRMELLAVIAGLEALTKPCRVTIYSDSRYVVDAVEKGSVFRWRDNDWWRTNNEKAKNADLWQRFLAAFEQHDVELKWVRSHADIPENERCDQLAVEAGNSVVRLSDVGYQPLGASNVSRTADKPYSSSPSKITHTEPGEACRKCGTAIIKRIPNQKKRKSGQKYYYEWYLFCPGCKAMYMVEAAKHKLDNTDSMFDKAS